MSINWDKWNADSAGDFAEAAEREQLKKRLALKKLHELRRFLKTLNAGNWCFSTLAWKQNAELADLRAKLGRAEVVVKAARLFAKDEQHDSDLSDALEEYDRGGVK